jgi:DIS3-like exonuclease 2
MQQSLIFLSLIRLLDAALKENSLDWKESVIQRLANHCNDKKLAAKRVSQASDEMFLASFIKECGPYDVKGMVLKVR